MQTVIFACVHNAGRSQMAAAFLDQMANPALARAISAGTRPAALGSHWVWLKWPGRRPPWSYSFRPARRRSRRRLVPVAIASVMATGACNGSDADHAALDPAIDHGHRA